MMAKGLMPVAIRVNIDPALRIALAVVCDMAQERDDGSYLAVVSARALASMLSLNNEDTARKLLNRLRAAGFITRGSKQSHWLVHLPSTRVVNDVVRSNWIGLGGRPENAPVISKRWQVSRAEYGKRVLEKPDMETRFPRKKTGHGDPVSDMKNRTWSAKKPDTNTRFRDPPLYRGLTHNTSSHTSEPTPPDGDTTQEGFEPARTASVGGGLAENGSPDASHQTSATDPDAVKGMLG